LYNGSSLADLLVQHESASGDVIHVAVCLIANLAVDEVSQVRIHSLIPSCTLVVRIF